MTELKINGKHHRVSAEGDTPLLWVLRDELNLTGTKYGCGIAQCGACTVHVDGQAMRSCVTPVQAVAGKSVTTIEGLSSKAATAVQAAWTQLNVAQCGYCQSGQIMTSVALLQRTPHPSDAQIDEALNGNLCRCATYQRIRAAVRQASQQLEA